MLELSTYSTPFGLDFNSEGREHILVFTWASRQTRGILCLLTRLSGLFVLKPDLDARLLNPDAAGHPLPTAQCLGSAACKALDQDGKLRLGERVPPAASLMGSAGAAVGTGALRESLCCYKANGV